MATHALGLSPNAENPGSNPAVFPFQHCLAIFMCQEYNLFSYQGGKKLLEFFSFMMVSVACISVLGSTQQRADRRERGMI